MDGAQLVVYDVLPMPTVTLDELILNGNALHAELGGYRKEAFTQMTVVAEGRTSGQVYLLGGAEDPFVSGAAKLDLTMPGQAVSDTYDLRIICSSDEHYQEITGEFVYINPDQPNAPTGVSAENAGDYMVAVAATAEGAYDGFRFTVRDAEGNIVNGMSDILLNKDGSQVAYDENGLVRPSGSEAAASFLIGGRFEQTVMNAEGEQEQLITGLGAGEYTIEVRTWKKTAGGAGILVSEPTQTIITVREPVKTRLQVQANAVNGMASLPQTMTNGTSDPYQVTTFADSSLNIRISSDTETFTGTWRIDGGFREDLRGEITEDTKQITLKVTDLAEGQHSLTFRGINQYGDSVSVTYIFAVDTLGPRVMLDAPVNGGLFDYWTGELAITGLTDRGAMLTVIDNTTGQTLLENEVLTLDEGGRFRSAVTLDRTILNHDLTICMADALGNAVQQEVSVMSNGLGSIEKLMICSGDADVTNTKLTAGGNYTLSLMAKLKKPADAQNAEDLIVKIGQDGMTDWNLQVLEGDAQLQDTPDGVMLTGSADAECLITARLLVSDAGAWSVCAAYGYTGAQILPLDKIQVQVVTTDQLYTGEPVTTQVQVWYRGTQLREGIDYTIGSYANNVEPTTEATVEILGMGDFTGSTIGKFAISYLPLDENWIAVTGTEGSNGWFVSDVSLIPGEGYELVAEEGTGFRWSDDGEHTVTFRVRRLSDGAMTDLVTRAVKIDKTAPTGTIALDETLWSKLLERITFGLYKVNDLSATITAEDNVSVDKIEYTITSQAITSATELADAGLTWKTYSELSKPAIAENTDQVIYVRITDTAGNVSYLGTDGIHVDTVAPEVGIVITGATSNSLSFTVTSSEAGSYFYLVRKASEPAPTVEELKAAAGGSFTAGQTAELTVSGLSPAVTYVVYALAEDTVVMLSTGEAAPNTSEVAASEHVTLSTLTLSEGTTEVTVEDMLYTGEKVEPAVRVVYDGTELTEGIDYTVEYLNNVEVSGEAQVRITGVGKYSGIVTKNFSISYLPLDESWIIESGIEGDNGWFVSDVSLIPAEGYELVIDGETADIRWSEDGEHTAAFRVRRLSDGAMTDLVSRAVKIDKAAPNGSVTVDTNVWKELLNTITFGLFFNKTQEAKIAADDVSSGVASIGYVVSHKALELSELKMQNWSDYTKPVELDADGEYVVYAKLTDNAGNITYLGTDGLVIDTVAPLVSGIEDGETYEGEVVFTIEEAYIDFVSINGETVTGVQHILKPMDEVQTIIVRDKAGNETVLNVYVLGCTGENCPSLDFVDLDTEAWYHLSVDYVLRKGLMHGYGNKYFGPGDPMSRAMVVQVLYNLEGRPAVSGGSPYTDVPDGNWFTDAIIWATENGIINGYGNGLYGPGDPVNREQMATIFYRYSRFKGYGLTEGSYDHFADSEKVSLYAQPAMRWAVGNGLLVGMADGTLCPGCRTNRAEFATVIQRFCETIAK